MGKLKLEIELIPKNAWGNNLRNTLPKKDWDIVRHVCYGRAYNICMICGTYAESLDAHEVWDFNIETNTQKLQDIIALCSACHGVKHMRNSERLGYGKNARYHFIKVNNCSQLEFAGHYLEAQELYDKHSKVDKWKLDISRLKDFGGSGIEILTILNPYEGINWLAQDFINTKKPRIHSVTVKKQNDKNKS